MAYPDQTDNLPDVVSLVGSFWASLYGGSNLVFDYCRGTVLAEKQLFTDLLELQASVGRETCPLYHTNLWYSLQLLQSEKSGTATFPIPEDVAELQYGTNGLTSATVSLVNGVDFVIDKTAHTITFLTDPFINSALVQTPVLDSNGDTVDEQIQLWFFHAKLDWQFIYTQFGYVIGPQLATNQNYKDLVNAIWSAWASATAYTDVSALVAAVTDIPCAKVQGETVEIVTADNRGQLVITDNTVYRFVDDVTITAEVDQVLAKGDQMCSDVYIFEGGGGRVPDLAELEVPGSFFDPVVGGSLTFSNSDEALSVTMGVSGYTKLTWPLGGDGPDVTAFFTRLHEKGVANAATLANYMDLRPQPQPTQPGPGNLPTTINPLEFLFQNALRANCFVIQVTEAGLGPNALGLQYLSYLRQVVPAHTAAIVVTV